MRPLASAFPPPLFACPNEIGRYYARVLALTEAENAYVDWRGEGIVPSPGAASLRAPLRSGAAMSHRPQSIAESKRASYA